jgi:hypothetical protein
MSIQLYIVNETGESQIKFKFCHKSFRFYDVLRLNDTKLTWPKEISINSHQKSIL